MGDFKRHPITSQDERQCAAMAQAFEKVLTPPRPYTFRDAQQAFADAIKRGVLSDDPHDPMFAGDFMYMHTEGQRDSFKHRDTRRYVHSVNA